METLKEAETSVGVEHKTEFVLGDRESKLRIYRGKEPMMDVLSGADRLREEALFPERRDGFYCVYESFGEWAPTLAEAIEKVIHHAMWLGAKGYRPLEVAAQEERNAAGIEKSKADAREAVKAALKSPDYLKAFLELGMDEELYARLQYLVAEDKLDAAHDALIAWHNERHPLPKKEGSS
jgi:hypothetical protein